MADQDTGAETTTGGASTETPSTGGGGTTETPGAGSEETTTGGVYRTQDEVDAAVEKRLARERKTIRKQIADEAAEEARKAQMTETERLKTEKQEADNKAKTVTEAANQRVVKAEARVIAATLGVSKEKLPYVIRMADPELKAVDVDDGSGDPDSEAIEAAIKKVLTDVPELVGGTTEEEETPQQRRRAPDATPTKNGKPDSRDQFNKLLRQRGLRT